MIQPNYNRNLFPQQRPPQQQFYGSRNPIIIKNSSSGIILGIFILLIIIAITVSILIYTGVIPNPLSKSSTQNTPLCSDGKVYDQSIQTCRINCEKDNLTYFPKIDKCCDTETTEYVDTISGCMKKCDTDEKRCGYDCYDPVRNECTTKDVQICTNSLVRHYKDVGGSIITECCGKVNNIQTYPVLNDTTGDEECKTCKFTVCGNQCCPDPKSTNPIDPFDDRNIHAGGICIDGKSCCADKYNIKDSNGNSVCCQTEPCNGICCGGIKKCDPKDNICREPCGNNYCTDSEICMTDKDSGENTCVPQGCQWDRTIYAPDAVYTYTKSDLYKNDNGDLKYTVPVCKTQNQSKNDPYWIVNDKSKASDQLISKVLVPLNSDWNNTNCNTMIACKNKISEKDLSRITKTNGTSSMIGGKCSADADCSMLLPTSDILKKSYQPDTANVVSGYYNKSSCPTKDVNGNDTLQCCIDPVSKEFSGLVCPQSQICYNDNSSNKNYLCYNINDSSSAPLDNCNNHGLLDTTIKNGIVCKCSPGYAGARCQFSNSVTCFGNGTVSNTGTCTCNPNFVLPNCKCRQGYKNSEDNTMCIPLSVNNDITINAPSLTVYTRLIWIILMPGVDIYSPNADLRNGETELFYNRSFINNNGTVKDNIHGGNILRSDGTSNGVRLFYFFDTAGTISYEIDSKFSINISCDYTGNFIIGYTYAKTPTIAVNWGTPTNYKIGERYIIHGIPN